MVIDPSLQAVLENVKSLCDTEEDMEVTLEANPGDLSSTALENFKKAGVTRFSIGIQVGNKWILDVH